MSPENERFLKQLVEYRRFPDFESALDAAVRFYREEYEKAVEVLREKVQEGLDDEKAGRVGPLDVAKLKARIEREFLRELVRHGAG